MRRVLFVLIDQLGEASGRALEMLKASRNAIVRWQVIVITLVTLFAVVACATTGYGVAGTTHESFLSTWAAQLEQYRAQFVERDAKIRAQAATVLDPDAIRRADDPWRTAVSRVFELSIMIRAQFEIAGRGESIKAFIAHMQSYPTPGLTDIWFLRQVEDVQREARDTDAKTQAVLENIDQTVRKGADWVREVEELARAQGMVTGKIEELQSLHKQAISYYGDLYRAQAIDQYRAQQQAQAAQNLLAVGAYLNQLNYQQQLLNTLNRPRTCSFFANMMTCQ